MHARTWRAAAVLVATAAGLVDAQSRIGYVHASRVVVRRGPDPNSAIAGRLTTNTAVEIQRQEADRCAVRIPSSGDSGFVLCALLGDRPLTLDDSARALADPSLTAAGRLDWTARAFWMAPSLARLIEAGGALQAAVFDLAALAREDDSGRSARYRHPEFEAMKTRLTSVQVTAVASRPALDDDYYLEHVDRLSKLIALPVTAPSFFRVGEPIAFVPLRPLGLSNSVNDAPWLADALSAAGAVPYRASRWMPDYQTHVGRMGVWDVSGVDVRFERPATVHAVTAAGRPTGYAVRALGMSIGAKPCNATPVSVYGTAVDAAWRAAIVGWAGRPAPGVAAVSSHVVEGATRWDRVAVDVIDLDRDGRSDIVRWSGIREPMVEHASRWGIVHANIGGAWTLMAYTDEPDCT